MSATSKVTFTPSVEVVPTPTKLEETVIVELISQPLPPFRIETLTVEPKPAPLFATVIEKIAPSPSASLSVYAVVNPVFCAR